MSSDRPIHEAFKPIAVRSPDEAPVLFALRRALDLQVLTIDRFLRPRLIDLRGRLLDVGAGEAPWRHLLTRVDYVGIDVEAADQFGMRRNAGVVYYDGRVFPFPDESFDHVLCVEVLEHVEDPSAFVREIARVLNAHGTLVLTVPWSARLHHLPHDYHRFSRFAIDSMLSSAGFGDIQIEERGDDVAVVANKLLVMTIRLVRSRQGIRSLWRWPLAVLMSPFVAMFLAAAHLRLGRRHATQDPLGYGVVARRL